MTMQIDHRAAATRVSAPVDFRHAPEDDLGECMKLIRKLRWIGLEDEAGRLQESLTRVAPDQRGTVLADCATTD
jgi:hypothetical protein